MSALLPSRSQLDRLLLAVYGPLSMLSLVSTRATFLAFQHSGSQSFRFTELFPGFSYSSITRHHFSFVLALFVVSPHRSVLSQNFCRASVTQCSSVLRFVPLLLQLPSTSALCSSLPSSCGVSARSSALRLFSSHTFQLFTFCIPILLLMPRSSAPRLTVF